MSAAYNDRWERTKRHLLRNFLVNPGFQLSPIPEEERSSPDSDGSLPDLVIEPEPNRHDESEEYYAGLEQRMRRYYRQLFLGAIGSEDEDSLDFEVNQSMTSTFIDDLNTPDNDVRNKREEERSTVPHEKVPIINERQLRDSADNSNDDDHETVDLNDVSKLIELNDIEHIPVDYFKETIEGQDEENSTLIGTASGYFAIETNAAHIVPNVNEEGNDDTQDIQSYDINRSSSTHKGRLEFNDNLNNQHLDSLKDIEDASKYINSKSDTEDSIPCHRISTTVVEIHEARPPKMSTHVSEVGSPVLVPQFLRFIRGVFGTNGAIRNDTDSVPDPLEAPGEIIERDSSQHTDESSKHAATNEKDIENTEEETLHTKKQPENVEEERDHDEGETDITEEETEVTEEETDNIENETERIEEETEELKLLTDSQLTNVSGDSAKSDSDVVLKTHDLDRNQGSVEKSSEHIIENQSQIRYSEHIANDEESIGTDEFNYTALDTKNTEITDTEESNSIEHAIRKGVFEQKNTQKTFAQSTDEDMESASDDDLEPVEVMRGPREARFESLIKEFAGTEDSPAFETRTSAHQLEEASDSSQENDIEKEPKVALHTPAPRTTVLSALDDFWSVSPIQVDIEESPKDSCQSSKKRRIDSGSVATVNKRKVRKDVVTQTSSNEHLESPKYSCGSSKKRKIDSGSAATMIKRKVRKDVVTQTSSNEHPKWEEIKDDFFVGTPLVLRLCGCQDHVCTDSDRINANRI